MRAVNQESLERANAFLAAAAARTDVGSVLAVTPAEIGRDIGLPDPLSAARAVRALIARRRLEPAQGSYRLVDATPVDPDEKETVQRAPRRRKAKRAGPPAPRGDRGSYSEIGHEVVEKLIDLGREVATLRSSLRGAREEARMSRDARIEAEQRAETLAARVRDLESRAEMAESNLRALLATARGAGKDQRDAVIGDTEMEAILGVLKTGDGTDEAPTA